ncbi:MAG TPA: SAF domain-containing protein [Acidimicrobiales bacterium]|nr:SAF domain-containing protein [Acidimicrobiales bacterium]
MASTPPPATGATAKAAARNRTRIVTGAFIVVVSALVAGLLYANIGGRHAVVAIARPVAAGQVIQDADLRETLAGTITGVRTTPWSARETVVGKTAAVNLIPGSLFNPAQLATGPTVDPSAAVVGAVLKPGQFPSGLRPGDRVLAIVMPPEAASATGQADIAAPIAVTVVSVEKLLDSGGGVSISLAVPPTEAATLAVAGAGGRLAVVLAPR